MKIWQGEQGSLEWHLVRRGIPTASEFKRILTPGGKLSKQADSYAHRLIGERLSKFLPERAESYTSRSMFRGTEVEAEARKWYSFHSGNEVQQVGFVKRDDEKCGCSPDGLIPSLCQGLELKAHEEENSIADYMHYLATGEAPERYLPQIHGGMAVTGYNSWVYASYHPDMIDQSFIVTVAANEYTTELKVALEMFLTRLDEMWETVKNGHC